MEGEHNGKMLETILQILYNTSKGDYKETMIDSKCSKMIVDYIQHLENKIEELEYKLKEKICFEGHQQFKELEEENKRLKEYISVAPNLDEMTAVKYRNIQESAYIRGVAEEQKRAKEIIHKDYISKLKIKKKIEEFKELSAEISGYDYQCIPKDIKRNDYAVKMLQELLRESEE